MTALSPELPVPTSEAIHFDLVSVRLAACARSTTCRFQSDAGGALPRRRERQRKSTLIKVIAGVYQATPGARTDYFGESVAAPTPQLAPARAWR